ncbi:hypothetical protein KB559_15180 [Paenibacillus sp. Marseille-P2973]|uniref:hypothetical protein n=1 Tax=Paenibacillus TaxID=44249 RepID=UPI001B38A5C7|nr:MULTISPECIES: hypothetical protein [Paenibacillus]MBQ4900176.1 hypothetical protein [Paenibacillus sp. Marseille-P2973]MDN4068716.1 hypothetical protein [Paenibacillus vini]
MSFLAKLAAFIAVIYLVKVFIYPFFRPVHGKQKKRNRKFIKERKNAQLDQKFQNFKRNFSTKYVGKLLGNAEKLRFQKMIDRLDLTMKPEELRAEQLFYALAGVIATMVLMTANQLLGFVTAIFIVLGWMYPVSEMEKKIEKKNKNIAFDFPAFYSMVYYQYSKSVNIYLADVIRDYLPNANRDMQEELGVMLDNIEYGEEYALKQLKKRVPIHYIIKFCDLMETRLKGYDNISQMVYLKNEVDSYRILALEEDLERRQRTNSRIQLVLIGVLVIYIAIYYLFTVLDSIKMFQ